MEAGTAAQRDVELVSADDFRLSDIKPECTPYHLINAALNVNRREVLFLGAARDALDHELEFVVRPRDRLTAAAFRLGAHGIGAARGHSTCSGCMPDLGALLALDDGKAAHAVTCSDIFFMEFQRCASYFTMYARISMGESFQTFRRRSRPSSTTAPRSADHLS